MMLFFKSLITFIPVFCAYLALVWMFFGFVLRYSEHYYHDTSLGDWCN